MTPRAMASLLSLPFLGAVAPGQPPAPAAVELLVVADSSFYALHGEQTRAVVEDRFNRVQFAFEDSGLAHPIELRVASVIVIEEPDADFVLDIEEEAGERNFNEVLIAFEQYRSTELSGLGHDLAILFTGVDLSGTVVGFSFVNVVCGSGPRSGILQATFPEIPNFEARFAGRTVAQGMGIASDAADPECADGEFLMASTVAVSNDPIPGFSDCSIDALNDGFAAGRYDCLFTGEAPNWKTSWFVY